MIGDSIEDSNLAADTVVSERESRYSRSSRYQRTGGDSSTIEHMAHSNTSPTIGVVSAFEC